MSVKNISLIFCFLFSISFSLVGKANDKVSELLKLPISDLSNLKVTSVSKVEEGYLTAPAAIYVITQDDIKRSGHNSIPELLRMAPGLQVARTDSNKWAISSRGFNRQFSNKLLVLIDGRSVYTPLFSGVYWDVQDVLLEDVDRIEVIRGPGATLWGANAVNGVINIVTKKAIDTQGSVVSATVGKHEDLLASARHGGVVGDNSHYRIYAKRSNRGNFDLANGSSANDSWYLSKAGFRYDSDNTKRNQYTIQGDIYTGEKNYPLFLPTITAPFINSVNADEGMDGANILFRWKKNFSSKSSTDLQLYVDYINRDAENGFVIGQERATYDFDFKHNWKLNERNEIVWGGGYRFIDDRVDESFYVDYDDLEVTYDIFNFFFQNKITLSPESLFLTLGSKFEHNDFSGFEIQPSARFSWLIDQTKTLWASVSRAVRTPSRNENSLNLTVFSFPPGGLGPGLPAAFVTQGFRPKNLESEDLLAYEIGYKFKFSKNILVDIAAFYNDYTDLLSFDIGSPFSTTTSFGSHLVLPVPIARNAFGNVYGLEVSSIWDPTDYWKIKANYTLLISNLDTKLGSTDTVHRTIENSSPRNQLNIISYYDVTDTLEVNNSLYYVDSIVGATSYIRFDAGFTWKPQEDFEVKLVGQNLFDDRHAEFTESLYSVPSQVTRNFYIKMTKKF